MIKNSINKSKLIQLISYLDNKEFKELGLWVRSPIHNNVQIVIDLYDVIKRKCRDTDKPIDALSIMKLLKMLPRTAREKDVSPRDKQELRRARTRCDAKSAKDTCGFPTTRYTTL